MPEPKQATTTEEQVLHALPQNEEILLFLKIFFFWQRPTTSRERSAQVQHFLNALRFRARMQHIAPMYSETADLTILSELVTFFEQGTAIFKSIEKREGMTAFAQDMCDALAFISFVMETLAVEQGFPTFQQIKQQCDQDKPKSNDNQGNGKWWQFWR